MGEVRKPAWFTWPRWAPTPRALTAVSPVASMGGAALTFASAPEIPTRLTSPWHEVQVIGTTSTVPFRCVATLTEPFV